MKIISIFLFEDIAQPYSSVLYSRLYLLMRTITIYHIPYITYYIPHTIYQILHTTPHTIYHILSIYHTPYIILYTTYYILQIIITLIIICIILCTLNCHIWASPMNTCLLGSACPTKLHHVTTCNTLATIWLLTYLQSVIRTGNITHVHAHVHTHNVHTQTYACTRTHTHAHTHTYTCTHTHTHTHTYLTNTTSFPPSRSCSLIIYLVLEKQFKNIPNQWGCGSLR